MSFHTEYMLAPYRAARRDREVLPLPGVADRRVRREFRDALLDARAHSGPGPRRSRPLRLRRALSALRGPRAVRRRARC